MTIKRNFGRNPERPLKLCSLCGEMVGNYQVIDNAILCYDCVPKQELSKKIMNESKMVKKILGDKNQKKIV